MVVSPNVGRFLTLSVALEGKNVHGLKLEKVVPTFSSFNAITAKMTSKKIILVVFLDKICLITPS